jgi:hypothetical protein
MSNANEHFFFSYIMTSYNRLDNDMMMSALYSTNTDFYSATSLKQQSMGRHFAKLRHIILISSQPVCVLSP